MEDFNIRTTFKPYLIQGEEIIWTGRPYAGLVFSMNQKVTIYTRLLAIAFVFLSVAINIYINQNFLISALVILLMSFLFVILLFWIEASKRKGLQYALTNKRALILNTSRSSSLKSFHLDAISKIELKHAKSGRGSIAFDVNEYASSKDQFEYIENVDAVYAMIVAR